VSVRNSGRLMHKRTALCSGTSKNGNWERTPPRRRGTTLTINPSTITPHSLGLISLRLLGHRALIWVQRTSRNTLAGGLGLCPHHIYASPQQDSAATRAVRKNRPGFFGEVLFGGGLGWGVWWGGGFFGFWGCEGVGLLLGGVFWGLYGCLFFFFGGGIGTLGVFWGLSAIRQTGPNNRIIAPQSISLFTPRNQDVVHRVPQRRTSQRKKKNNKKTNNKTQKRKKIKKKKKKYLRKMHRTGSDLGPGDALRYGLHKETCIP